MKLPLTLTPFFKYSITLIVILHIFIYCGGPTDSMGSDTEPMESGHYQGLSWSEFEEIVYKEPGDDGVYIVNGDIPIPNPKKLREYYDQNIASGNSSRMIVSLNGGSDEIWSASHRNNITYCISNSFGSRKAEVVAAMSAAAEAWEAHADIDFVYRAGQDSNCTNSNSNVLFDVNPANANGQYLARAFFPFSSRAYRNVLIDNSSFNTTAPLSLTGILRHELGHVLGLRHEHTRPNSGTCFEDNNWREITAYDSQSVMHYPQCNGDGDWSLTLTAADIEGIGEIYGQANQGTDPAPPTDEDDYDSLDYDDYLEAGDQLNYGPFLAAANSVIHVDLSGSGDADLYVRLGSKPSTSSYSCRPYMSSSLESCSINIGDEDTVVYVMVYGYSQAEFDLNVKYISASPSNDSGSSDTITGSVNTDQQAHYGPYTAQPGSIATVSMTGSGDGDLYVRFGASPTLGAYQCRPYQWGTNEKCEVTVPAGNNQLYIMVYGYESATFEIEVTYESASTGPTEHTVSTTDSVALQEKAYYTPISVVAGTDVTVSMTGSGDADLYLRFNGSPSLFDYDCRPYKNGSSETCTLTVPDSADKLYIMVYGYAAASYSLEVTYFSY